MPKEIARQVHEGETVEPKPKSNGIPATGRGQGQNNSGRTIKTMRMGRGSI